MRIVCRRLLDARGRLIAASPYLTVGRAYLVLEVSVDFNGPVHVRVVDDSGVPGLFAIEAFEVTDSSVARSWQFRVGDGGFLLGPEPWMAEGFWERFFEDDIEAAEAYESTLPTLQPDGPFS